MRSLQAKTTCTGAWGEYLDSTISIFHTLLNMYQVNDLDKLKANPIIFYDMLFYIFHPT